MKSEKKLERIRKRIQKEIRKLRRKQLSSYANRRIKKILKLTRKLESLEFILWAYEKKAEGMERYYF